MNDIVYHIASQFKYTELKTQGSFVTRHPCVRQSSFPVTKEIYSCWFDRPVLSDNEKNRATEN